MGDAGVYVAVSVRATRSPGSPGRCRSWQGHPAFWGVYLDRRRRRRDRGEGGAGRREGRGRAVRRDGAGPDGEHPGPDRRRVNLWQAGQSIGSVRVNEPGCPIWHELTSPDLPTATQFYADVLGVEWESMPMETGDDYTCLMVEGRPVGGAFPPRWRASRRTGTSTSTSRTATPPSRRRPSSAASVLAPPCDVPGVGRMAMVRDPQGAIVGLMQNPPENGRAPRRGPRGTGPRGRRRGSSRRW